MLRLENVGKNFFGVPALADATIDILPGEVLGVMGENGAGKSTFIKIACGVHQPDSGRILLDGKERRFADCADAMAAGIALVHQEIQVVPDFSVAENVMLDKLSLFKRNGRIDWKRLEAEAEKHLDKVGLALSPQTIVRGLSSGQKQLTLLAKCLSGNARIVFLDEPTSSISKAEADHLFGLVDSLKGQGVAIVFVSHKMDEVFRLCDRLVVLRDGKVSGSGMVTDLTREQVVEMMIGRKCSEERLGWLPPADETVLSVRGLTKRGMADNVSFDLRKGEILGFYGLVGSGRTETARMIIGDMPFDAGEVILDGRPERITSVSQALHSHGIGYISENRKEGGLILDASVQSNLTLPILQQLRTGLTRRIDLRKERAQANESRRALSIKSTGVGQPVKYLSGGNQQKVSIGKWLLADCRIMIFDEPTVGVDIGSKAFIHDLIFRLARDDRKAVILISSDLTEMAKLASRILLFRAGKILGEIDDINKDGVTVEDVSKKVGRILI